MEGHDTQLGIVLKVAGAVSEPLPFCVDPTYQGRGEATVHHLKPVLMRVEGEQKGDRNLSRCSQPILCEVNYAISQVLQWTHTGLIRKKRQPIC